MSKREHIAGIALFLSVTAAWMLYWSISFELGWIPYSDAVALVGVVLSALSLVVTGYLGRYRDALLLGWIPGAAAIAIGIAMTPEPGGDETGWSMIWFGGLMLIPVWQVYFFPLMALGTWLHGRFSSGHDLVTPQSRGVAGPA